MKNKIFTANKISKFLNKPQRDFTKKDIIKFVEKNDVQLLNFRYTAGDGRLKTLSFAVQNRQRLDKLLSLGERVDGSSLFSYVDASSSDLYVLPRYRTAYVNPFSEIPAVDILCSFYTSDGARLSNSPENAARRAQEVLLEKTGFSLEAMGELEYYVISPKEDLYPVAAQKGYHESLPFSRWENLRNEAMMAIAQAGGAIKYSHAEVGHIQDAEREMSQHEIEFLPVPIEEAADQLVLAKWMIQMLGRKYGVIVTFAPKIFSGHAGSGMHIHSRLVKNGKPAMTKEGGISDDAKKLIAGYLSMASSLTAFGNTVPTSYLRLVPHQEAPTNICWGDRNRSVLVRVPLGWLNVGCMVKDANPLEKSVHYAPSGRQTVEFRASDGSANVYYLLAGLAVAARHGLLMKNWQKIVRELYVGVNIFSSEHKHMQEKLPQLPSSCAESAQRLLADRASYEEYGVFPPGVIDGTAKKLQSYNDKNLSEKLFGKEEEIRRLVREYLYC
ncbi:MAG: glutamine synthetase family protein [Elusimicrobia bacterium]|nr:glutamine synthetase family protein [Elusimicrobiota bacterium]